jgi:hypothetical protein
MIETTLTWISSTFERALRMTQLVSILASYIPQVVLNVLPAITIARSNSLFVKSVLDMIMPSNDKRSSEFIGFVIDWQGYCRKRRETRSHDCQVSTCFPENCCRSGRNDRIHVAQSIRKALFCARAGLRLLILEFQTKKSNWWIWDVNVQRRRKKHRWIQCHPKSCYLWKDNHRILLNLAWSSVALCQWNTSEKYPLCRLLK